MKQFYYSFFKYLMVLIISFATILISSTNNCVICLQPLNNTYLLDAWGNKFHTHHENQGIFCNSCSRIISEGVTKGGYIYKDGRYICSLCQASSINNEADVHLSYINVIKQLNIIGIDKIRSDIPIKLISFNELNQESNNLGHAKLKAITKTIQNNQNYTFKILILYGLPKLEFEAVLAHELLHTWLYDNQINLSPLAEEGFCNLGRYIIYNNDQTQFASIHLESMEKDTDPGYGIEYRKFKLKLKQLGWEKLIFNIMN